MAYYPGWLDYLAWALGACGVVFGFCMLPEPAGRKRGLLKLGFCSLLGLGIAFGAVGGVLFNVRAPHLTKEGTLFDVVVHGGRGSSTTFRLRIPSGEVDDLSLSGAHHDLVNGEIASVTYQDESHSVLEVQILEGPYAGNKHGGNDGLVPSWIGLFFGFGLAGYGVLDWRNDGTAISSTATSTLEEDSRPAPDGDVDTKSMLDLESK